MTWSPLPLRFAFTLSLPLAALAACADAEQIAPPAADSSTVTHEVHFVGNVYDGVSGARLTGFSIDVTSGDTIVNGTISGEGRYSVGPISAWSDFSVLIGNSGYRAFLSHNAAIGLPSELSQSDDIADIGTLQTLHFDAYLFPDDLQAPAVSFTIATTVAGQSPSGRIRLLPVGPSLLTDSPSETPGGVPGQVWVNDEDLQTGAINGTFGDGTFAINAGDLVYGVQYQVDIFDVPGFQPLTANYSAGVETNKTFTLTEEIGEPVAVTSSTHTTCQPPASANATSGATITVEFNQPVEFADSGYPGGPEEALDDGISINSPNANMDAAVNQLFADLSDTNQERGVSATVNNNTLTINFNPSLGLEMKDPADPIVTTTYTGLGNVQLQRVNSPSSATTLSTLIGTSSVVCD